MSRILALLTVLALALIPGSAASGSPTADAAPEEHCMASSEAPSYMEVNYGLGPGVTYKTQSWCWGWVDGSICVPSPLISTSSTEVWIAWRDVGCTDVTGSNS